MFIFLKVEQDDAPIRLLPRIAESNATMRQWICKPVNSKTDDINVSIEFLEKSYGVCHKESIQYFFQEGISISESEKENLYISIDDFLSYFLTNTRTDEDKQSLEEEYGIANGWELYEAKAPYDPKKISIVPNSWPVTHIYDLMTKYQKIDIDETPDFQRRFVWNSERQSRLIESLMLGIPMPAFYMAESDGKYQVVDGLQRLTTIKNFLDGKFPLRYLEYLNNSQGEKNQEGRYYIPIDKTTKDKTSDNGEKLKIKKGIDNEYVFRILQTMVNVNLIMESSPFQVKFDVFRRLNEGGKPLNNQEIRNCIANERIRKFLKELAGNLPFRKNEDAFNFKLATDNTLSVTRMEPEEYVLRFIGFWFIRIKKDTKLEYTGNMQGFLNETIDKLNKLIDERTIDANILESIRIDFKRAMSNCHHLFGKYAFRKCLPKDLEDKAKRQPLNKALFTVLSITTCHIKTESLKEKDREFIHLFAQYLKDDEKLQRNLTAGTSDKMVLNDTFTKVISILQQNFNIDIQNE